MHGRKDPHIFAQHPVMKLKAQKIGWRYNFMNITMVRTRLKCSNGSAGRAIRLIGSLRRFIRASENWARAPPSLNRHREEPSISPIYIIRTVVRPQKTTEDRGNCTILCIQRSSQRIVYTWIPPRGRSYICYFNTLPCSSLIKIEVWNDEISANHLWTCSLLPT